MQFQPTPLVRSGDASVSSERILNTGETPQDRELTILKAQFDINQRLLAEIFGPHASQKDLTFKVRKQLWFFMRGEPDYYKTYNQIDAELSGKAAVARGLPLPPYEVTRVKPEEQIRIVQNLIKSADASQVVKEQLRQIGFHLEKIEDIGLRKLREIETESQQKKREHAKYYSNSNPQKLRMLLKWATHTDEVAAQMQKNMGEDLRLRLALLSAEESPVSSAGSQTSSATSSAADSLTSSAIASAPASFTEEMKRLEGLTILDILESSMPQATQSFEASVLQSGSSARQVR